MHQRSNRLTRRRFISTSTSLAATSVAAPWLCDAAGQPPETFRSRWHECPDRMWLGAEYWANPLQDGRVSLRRTECTHAAPDRNVHVLTCQLGDRQGTLDMVVRIGRIAGALTPAAWAGFRIGARGPVGDYRN